jgi:hypothetical protein
MAVVRPYVARGRRGVRANFADEQFDGHGFIIDRHGQQADCPDFAGHRATPGN